MITIYLKNPVSPSYWEFNIPDVYWEEFQLKVLPYFQRILDQAAFETQYEEQFGFAWGVVIAAAISAVSSWLQSRGGSTNYWSQWGWDTFVNEMKKSGCVTDNPKFAYCNHCDNNTYRVWIDNSGNPQYSLREKEGKNCRVPCGMLPQQVLDIMPMCSDGSKPTHDPTGSSTGYPSSNLPDAPIGNYTKYILLGGLGLVFLLMLSKSRKK